ncbi:hypothetical protein WJX72_007301 [[Myrmecia] bisecta]|uniref:D-xylose 1-dehydrogenase (NADP(+), D-xylono-1,5-lactone-forming) n=1 Tax=[Myrmecia] bisecta TaxID=41462 RepID=A0AAW1PDW4_9CHLO
MRSVFALDVVFRDKTQSAGGADPLPVCRSPNPFQHESDWARFGVEASIKADLWEAMKCHPDGLTFDEIIENLKQRGDNHCKHEGVREELEENPYFFKLPSSKWTLSIFRPLKWGFADKAQIAEDFIEALSLLPGPELAAVASRKVDDGELEAAQEFAKKHGVQRVYGTYKELAEDPDVELVYVSNIHVAHKDTVLLMLEHGKHVLCEKPLAVNARDTKEMVNKAREKNLFFAAGLWSRFFPAVQKIRELIQCGTIGEVGYFHADFLLQMGEEVKRLYTPEMGGGALLDIGMYPIAMGSWVFGQRRPDAVQAMAVMHPNRIDTTGVVNLRYGERSMSTVTYSMALPTAPIVGVIHGSKGRITIHDKMHCPTKITVEIHGKEPFDLEFSPPEKPPEISHGDAEGGWNFEGSMGFVYEAMAIHSAVVSGVKELKDVSNDEMVMLMEVTDEIRKQIGVTYPQDEK